jgi:nucleotide-binding universal stress UspA family protein
MTENRLRLLVPLDGTPESESVLPALLPLFRSKKVSLMLLGVGPGPESSEALELYLGRLRTSLLLDEVTSEFRVEWGDPAVEILRAGKPAAFDLLAMATHGRTGLRRDLVGSTAETVLRQSQIPVLAFRPGAKVGDWKRMVVGLDGSSAAEGVLGDPASRSTPETRSPSPRRTPGLTWKPRPMPWPPKASWRSRRCAWATRPTKSWRSPARRARDSSASRLTGGRVWLGSCWGGWPKACSAALPARSCSDASRLRRCRRRPRSGGNEPRGGPTTVFT